MYIILTIFLGLILRLNNIIKPEGLWNDEYVSWFVAATPFNNGFWEEVFKQCHMPLYYLYLKPFAGCSDLVLRLTSVLAGVVAISVMYLVGKEFSHKIANRLGILTATLPFLIYYSQEVRFYSLLFLFSAISLLFTIKVVKKPNNKNLVCWAVSAGLILFTHVIGGIYVFFNLAYLLYKKKNYSLKIAGIVGFFAIITLIFGINIVKMIPSSQWWGHFSHLNIMFMFSDFLSPILTNHVNTPAQFFYIKNLYGYLMLVIPTVIGLFGLIKGYKEFKGLAWIAILTVFATAILAMSGKIVFITKYVIEVLPILLLILITSLSNIRLGTTFFTVILAFNLLSTASPYYWSRLPKQEGHNLAATMINKANPETVVFTYYAPNRFERYLSKDLNAKKLHISKINRFDYMEKPAEILKNIKKGETVSVLFLNSISFIPEKYLSQAKENGIAEMFITFSKIKIGLIKELDSNYTNFKVNNSGSWTLITATKLK